MRFGPKSASGKGTKAVAPTNEAATVDPPDVGSIGRPPVEAGAGAGAGTHAIPASQAAACAGTDAAAATQAAASQAAAIEPDPSPSPVPSPPQSAYASKKDESPRMPKRNLALGRAPSADASFSEGAMALDTPAMQFTSPTSALDP
ncbi:hypothetical protein AB1Y20_012445 [Prymnesium parvum]|uniref:Uncharacterized protein n=1 Tax=Prymnesium parvum TaxID=97485 RepID=A0AB34IIG3_PRYPA